MEAEIIKKLNLRSIKAELQQVQLSEEEEFQFAQRAYKAVKEFSAFNSKQGQRVGLTEFFVKNAERLFKPPRNSSLEAEVSRFVSALTLHKNSSEVALYRELFLNNVSVKAAKLFVKFFLEMSEINPTLYDNRSKLLRHLKLDIKKALNLSAIIFKDDIAIANFSQAISNLLEGSKGNVHSITADQFGKHLMGSYFLSRNVTDKNREEGGEIWLNWNSADPQAFEIAVPALPNPKDHAVHSTSTDPSHPDNGFALERVNADFRKEVRKQKAATSDDKAATLVAKSQVSAQTKTAANGPQEPGNVNLFKICHKYVFSDSSTAPSKSKNHQEATIDLSSDVDIDKQLIFLRNKLEKQKLELDMQKNVWKLVLSNSKQAIRNYRDLKGEISSTEALTNAFLNVIDKNTDEWRRLYVIKSNDIEELYRYKFLIAAVLESCSQDLSRDLKDFRFAHDEDNRQMDTLLGQKHGFDLNEYLNAVYKSNRLKFDAALAADEIAQQELQHEDDVEEDSEMEAQARADRLDEFDFHKNGKNSQPKNSQPKKSSNQVQPTKHLSDADPRVGAQILLENGNDEDDLGPEDDDETDEEKAERLRNMRSNLDRMKNKLVHGKPSSNNVEGNRSAKSNVKCEIISGPYSE